MLRSTYSHNLRVIHTRRANDYLRLRRRILTVEKTITPSIRQSSLQTISISDFNIYFTHTHTRARTHKHERVEIAVEITNF